MESELIIKNDKNDLTTGPIIKKLLVFFLPIAMGTLFQQLYNTVDALVVSKYVGTSALAAVGGTPATVISLILGFFIALTAGCAVVIAHYFGAKDGKMVKEGVLTSYVLCAFLGIVAGALVVIFTPQILKFLKTPQDIIADATVYQRIYFGGSIFILIYNMGAGILRAVGNSRYPFICLIVSCLVNIVLDLLFVIAFDMGVSGVAYATVVAQIVSATMVTLKLILSKNDCKLTLKGIRFNKSILAKMLKIGVPSGVQASMYGISNTILQVGVNTLGTVIIASWTMASKADAIYWSIANAFGTAVTTFVGQNYGAKQFDRIKRTTKYSAILLFSISITISCFLMGLRYIILNILTDDAEVIKTSAYIMATFVPVYFTWSFIEVYSGVLRGVGDTLIPSIILAITICVFRIIWVYTMFKAYGTLIMLCICYPISWAVSDVCIISYYYIKERLKKKKDKIKASV